MKKETKPKVSLPRPPRASRATREFAAKDKALAKRRSKLPRNWKLVGKRPQLPVNLVPVALCPTSEVW